MEWISRRSLIGAVLSAATTRAAGPERPNILWITAEDLSPTLGCYGDPVAVTPNLDRLAREGVRFTRAFANAPVCSPARSCLITGVYPTSTGMHQHRSRVPVPPPVRGFAALLRAAGYFCTNNAKTDYNVSNEPAFVADCWGRCDRKAHWRQRKVGQPFFSVFNFEITHQACTSAWPYAKFEEMIRLHLRPEERCRPEAVRVPPYYPDTPIVRRTIAREYDCLQVLDRVYVARILRELEEDGLAGDTVVFFFSDHGSGLPRHKRVLYDSGLLVPLLIRFPEKYRHLAPASPGTAVDRLVSFVDFAPSELSLAGLPIPQWMQGVPFLGPNAGPPRQYVFGARDRIDEAFDCSRSVRDSRWLYIRHYHPHVPWSQPEYYSREEEIRLDIARLDAEGKLDPVQKAFTTEKPTEELFDSQTDPDQIRNLAGSAAYSAVLRNMRRALQDWMTSVGDLGFTPEEELYAQARKGPVKASPRELARRLKVAGKIGDRTALKRQARLLDAPDAAVRFWALVSLRAGGNQAGFARERLLRCLEDVHPSARLEAASTLGAMERSLPAEVLPVLVRELESGNLIAALRAARILWSFGERARPVEAAIRQGHAKLAAREAQQPEMRVYFFAIRAALSAALERLDQKS